VNEGNDVPNEGADEPQIENEADNEQQHELADEVPSPVEVQAVAKRQEEKLFFDVFCDYCLF